MVITQSKNSMLGKFLKKYAILLKKIDPGLAAASRKTFLHVQLSVQHQNELKKAFNSIEEGMLWQDFIQLLLDNKATILDVFKEKDILCYSEIVIVPEEKKTSKEPCRLFLNLKKHFDYLPSRPQMIWDYLEAVQIELTFLDRTLLHEEYVILKNLVLLARGTNLTVTNRFSFDQYATIMKDINSKLNDCNKIKTSESPYIKTTKSMGKRTQQEYGDPLFRVENTASTNNKREKAKLQPGLMHQLSRGSGKLQQQDQDERTAERRELPDAPIHSINTTSAYGWIIGINGKPVYIEDTKSFKGSWHDVTEPARNDEVLGESEKE